MEEQKAISSGNARIQIPDALLAPSGTQQETLPTKVGETYKKISQCYSATDAMRLDKVLVELLTYQLDLYYPHFTKKQIDTLQSWFHRLSYTYASQLKTIHSKPLPDHSDLAKNINFYGGIASDAAIGIGIIANMLAPYIGPVFLLSAIAKRLPENFTIYLVEVGHATLSLLHLSKPFLVQDVVENLEISVLNILKSDHSRVDFANLHAFFTVLTHAELFLNIHKDEKNAVCIRLAERFGKEVFNCKPRLFCTEVPSNTWFNEKVKLIDGSITTMDQLFSYSPIEVYVSNSGPSKYIYHELWEPSKNNFTGRRLIFSQQHALIDLITDEDLKALLLLFNPKELQENPIYKKVIENNSSLKFVQHTNELVKLKNPKEMATLISAKPEIKELLNLYKRCFGTDTSLRSEELHRSLHTVSYLSYISWRTSAAISLKKLIAKQFSAIIQGYWLTERSPLYRQLLNNFSEDKSVLADIQSVVSLTINESIELHTRQAVEVIAKNFTLLGPEEQEDYPFKITKFRDDKERALHWFFSICARVDNHKYSDLLRFMIKDQFQFDSNNVTTIREALNSRLLSECIQGLMTELLSELDTWEASKDAWWNYHKNGQFKIYYDACFNEFINKIAGKYNNAFIFSHYLLTIHDPTNVSINSQEVIRRSEKSIEAALKTICNTDFDMETFNCAVDHDRSRLRDYLDNQRKNAQDTLSNLKNAEQINSLLTNLLSNHQEGYHPSRFILNFFDSKISFSQLPLPHHLTLCLIDKPSRQCDVVHQIFWGLRSHFFHQLSIEDTYPKLDWSLLMICAQWNQEALYDYCMTAISEEKKVLLDNFSFSAQDHHCFFERVDAKPAQKVHENEDKQEDLYSLYYVKQVYRQLNADRDNTSFSFLCKRLEERAVKSSLDNFDKIKSQMHTLVESLMPTDNCIIFALKGSLVVFEDFMSGIVAARVQTEKKLILSQGRDTKNSIGNSNNDPSIDLGDDEQRFNMAPTLSALASVKSTLVNDRRFKTIMADTKYISLFYDSNFPAVYNSEQTLRRNGEAILTHLNKPKGDTSKTPSRGKSL